MSTPFAEHAFGQIESFQIGVEEELFLVDTRTREPSHTSQAVLDAMAVPLGTAKLEFYADLLELASPVSREAGAAVEALRRLRAAAGATGVGLMGAGLHPTAPYGDVRLVEKPRWLAVADVHGRANFRSAEAALHVHVGMPDPHVALSVFNGLREHLPLLLALSGNSPFWFGSDSGLASSRTIQNRAFQRFDLPPAFDSYDEYAEDIDATLAAGELSDYTLVWWHVRVHPRLGTVEVRVMDSQASLELVAGLAALVQGLAMHAAESRQSSYSPRQALAESLHRGCRYGLDAKLWSDGGLRGVPQLAREAVEVARGPLRAIGGDPALEGVERILVEGNGADRQRADYARGGFEALLEALVTQTQSG